MYRHMQTYSYTHTGTSTYTQNCKHVHTYRHVTHIQTHTKHCNLSQRIKDVNKRYTATAWFMFNTHGLRFDKSLHSSPSLFICEHCTRGTPNNMMEFLECLVLAFSFPLRAVTWGEIVVIYTYLLPAGARNLLASMQSPQLQFSHNSCCFLDLNTIAALPIALFYQTFLKETCRELWLHKFMWRFQHSRQKHLFKSPTLP